MKYLCYFLILFLAVTSCSKPWGDRSFGKNLTLLKGDKEEEQVIVYSMSADDKRTNGVYVIPTKERHMIDGKIAEYVDKVATNDKWLIATTIQVKDKKVNYWIINKDFAVSDMDCIKTDCGEYVKNFVTGPLSLEDFNGSVEELEIDLSFPRDK